jgi:hypothetical protein
MQYTHIFAYKHRYYLFCGGGTQRGAPPSSRHIHVYTQILPILPMSHSGRSPPEFATHTRIHTDITYSAEEPLRPQPFPHSRRHLRDTPPHPPPQTTRSTKRELVRNTRDPGKSGSPKHRRPPPRAPPLRRLRTVAGLQMKRRVFDHAVRPLHAIGACFCLRL